MQSFGFKVKGLRCRFWGLGWTPPGTVTPRDNDKDYMKVALYSYSTSFTEWGVLLSNIHLPWVSEASNGTCFVPYSLRRYLLWAI